MSGVPMYAGGPGQGCCSACPCIDPTTCPPAYYATTSGWPSSYPSDAYPPPAPNPHVVALNFNLLPPVWNVIVPGYYGVEVAFKCIEISPGVCAWILEVAVTEVLDGTINVFTPNECLPLGTYTVPISNSDGSLSFDVTVILSLP